MTAGPSHASDIDLLIDASIAAGKAALSYFRNDVQVWWKNEGTSPVTAADHAANDVLKDMLIGARPDYGWLSEESEDDVDRLTRTRTFIVDPIDGTRAFMQGKDTWVVSAAIIEAGRPIAGVLFAPSLEEIYVATADGAVTKNGKPLKLAEAGSGERFRLSAADDLVNRLAPATRERIDRVSRIPSLAYRLAMIADGRLDVTLVKPNAHDWDIAAAHLILANAGGRLTDTSGSEPVYNSATPSHGILIASHKPLHDGIIASLPPDLVRPG
jgi:myo-inositol-1(or 4)-monophosphatase